mmetsp:Transcript_14139/g.22062  ORF Transcript_14139/g.22062 Transcript_14139/m.22062 type:complete len:206 (-) Transcript_14139:9-626(-)
MTHPIPSNMMTTTKKKKVMMKMKMEMTRSATIIATASRIEWTWKTKRNRISPFCGCAAMPTRCTRTRWILEMQLSSDLCKVVTMSSTQCRMEREHEQSESHSIFVHESFEQLEHKLIAEHFYTPKDMQYIRSVLLVDILSICPVLKWYFVEWQRCDQAKQMIIAHFDVEPLPESIPDHDEIAHELLFVVWSIEWPFVSNEFQHKL